MNTRHTYDPAGAIAEANTRMVITSIREAALRECRSILNEESTGHEDARIKALEVLDGAASRIAKLQAGIGKSE